MGGGVGWCKVLWYMVWSDKVQCVGCSTGHYTVGAKNRVDRRVARNVLVVMCGSLFLSLSLSLLLHYCLFYAILYVSSHV